MYSFKSKKYFFLVLQLILLLMLCSCPGPDYTYKRGPFPETVTALSGANSPYDDFNSAPPPTLVHLSFHFYFSSNRATQGGSFDIENFEVKVDWDQTTGGVSLDAQESSSPSPWQSLNSANNEFGPYYIGLDWYNKLYMLASDGNGNLDIFHDGKPSVALNSNANDAYPSLGQGNIFYFSSDRGGNYDIYSAPVPTSQSIAAFLETAGATVTPVDSVNSTGDDKAPYVNGNLMIFASNRSGGYGGYDLWYSTYGEGGWSEPVNFGPDINTESDEFRPVVLISDSSSFTNDLMIFSSDRPGGLGGFDLYWVGIPKLTQ